MYVHGESVVKKYQPKNLLFQSAKLFQNMHTHTKTKTTTTIMLMAWWLVSIQKLASVRKRERVVKVVLHLFTFSLSFSYIIYLPLSSHFILYHACSRIPTLHYHHHQQQSICICLVVIFLFVCGCMDGWIHTVLYAKPMNALFLSLFLTIYLDDDDDVVVEWVTKY